MKGRGWCCTGLGGRGLPITGALARMVVVIEGMRGTVTSRARALYRRICEVALKSPRGSAVTIMTPFWGFRRGPCAWELDEEGKELENSSSVSLHWRYGTMFGCTC